MANLIGKVFYPIHRYNDLSRLADEYNRESLFQELHLEQQSQQLVKLFDQLDSGDEEIVRNAEEEITYLQNHIPFATFMKHSLPLFPPEEYTLEQIANCQFRSRHALVRERARAACAYLFSNQFYETASRITALIACEKIESSDEAIQKEAIRFFILLIQNIVHGLSRKHLELAISVAKKMCMEENPPVEPNGFFEVLVAFGNKSQVELLNEPLLELCASPDRAPFTVSHNICIQIANKWSVFSNIPLKVATNMVLQGSGRENHGWLLFQILLKTSPESTVLPLLQLLKVESQKATPHYRILRLLDSLLARGDTRVGEAVGKALEDREKNPPTIEEILTHLSASSSIYIQEEAKRLKEKIQEKMDESKENVPPNRVFRSNSKVDLFKTKELRMNGNHPFF